MALKDKNCRGCKKTIQVEIPDDIATESLRKALERMPIICDECDEKTEKHEEELKRQTERRAYLDRIKASGLPRDMIGLAFRTLEKQDQQAKALPDVERWARGDIQGLLLGGEVGVGKSYLAATAANMRLLSQPLDWVTVSKLMIQARSGFKNPSREEVTKLLLNGRRGLVLDDIDKNTASDYALEVLYEAIESRTSNGAPLLVTTNLHYDEMVEQIGEAISSRIAGYCTAHFIEGDDLRRAA